MVVVDPVTYRQVRRSWEMIQCVHSGKGLSRYDFWVIHENWGAALAFYGGNLVQREIEFTLRFRFRFQWIPVDPTMIGGHQSPITTINLKIIEYNNCFLNFDLFGRSTGWWIKSTPLIHSVFQICCWPEMVSSNNWSYTYRSIGDTRDISFE